MKTSVLRPYLKGLILVGALISGLSAAAQIPSEGLVGWWTFSGDAIEKTGTGNDGAIFGAQLMPDRCGNMKGAYSFDGIDDYIECTSDSMNITNAMSISLWFRSTTTGFDALVAKYSWTEDHGYLAQFDPSGSPEIRGRDGNNVFSESNTDGVSRADGNWHHFVGIIDSSTWTAYIDTVMIASFDNGHTMVDIGSCTFPLTFGRLSEYTGSNWRFYEGSLDDIAIYNRPVTQTEIGQLYGDNCTSSALSNEISAATPSIQIFPNPTNGLAKIKIMEGLGNIDYIKVTDPLGREVRFDEEKALSNGIVDLTNQPRGMYLLHLRAGRKVYNRHIILN